MADEGPGSCLKSAVCDEDELDGGWMSLSGVKTPSRLIYSARSTAAVLDRICQVGFSRPEGLSGAVTEPASERVKESSNLA